jgi:Leucine-rich repeat (LRR) protein
MSYQINITPNTPKIEFPSEPNKIVDASFFLQKITPQGNAFTSDFNRKLNESKWVVFRRSIHAGNFIKMHIPPHVANDQEKAYQQLSNYLKILRLTPTKDSCADCLIEVSTLFPKILKNSQLIIPCAISSTLRVGEPQGILQLIKEKCPDELKGIILKDLPFFEIEQGSRSRVYVPFIGKNFQAQFSQIAQDIIAPLLRDYSGKGYLLDDDAMKKLEPIRRYVTNLKITACPYPHVVSQLSFIFPNLSHLDLSNTSATDAIISELSSFQNPKSLNLDSSNVTGATFSHLPQSLLRLDCSQTCLTDEALLGLTSCPNLEELNLFCTSITGASFSHLPHYLKKLDCSWCRGLTEQAIEGLKGWCAYLEELTIKLTLITGASFSHLPASLRKLNCSSCRKLTEQAIDWLKGCQLLEELDISCTPITGVSFSQLPASLRKLDCLYCHMIEDEAIKRLRGCTQLEELNVGGPSLREPNFAFIPSLKKLSCQDCASLDEEALISLQFCKKLEVLSIVSTPCTGASFSYLPSSLKKFECSHYKIRDAAIECLKGCTQLEELDFSDTALEEPNFTIFPNLRKLNCSDCFGIYDNFITSLWFCQKLEELNVSNTCITGETFANLPYSLKILSCRRCQRGEAVFFDDFEMQRGIKLERGEKIVYNFNFNF